MNIKTCLKKAIPSKIAIKFKFKRFFGYKLNLKQPKTIQEKLAFLKLYDRNPNYSRLVDKIELKKYVEEKIGAEYVVPIVGGPWRKVSEIDIDLLPTSFVLKCNADSGTVFAVKDKTKFKLSSVQNKLESSLKRNFFWESREWPYKKVKRKIFAESFLDDGSGDALIDYKWFCFNGEPKIMYIGRDRGSKPTNDWFDMEFNQLGIQFVDPPSDSKVEKPLEFDKMKQLARLLSEGIPFVRVDFYLIAHKIYVGEMTFFHCGGYFRSIPKKWDLELGDMISLENSYYNRRRKVSPKMKRF